MRVRTAAAAIVTATLLLAAGVGQPARAEEYHLKNVRWAAGVAVTGSRLASMVVSQVRYERMSPQRYPGTLSFACVGLVNKSLRRAAVACDYDPATLTSDPQTTNAVGSVRARVRRTDTGAAVGWTTLRYSVRWTSTTSPTPRLHGGGAGCPPLPWSGWRGRGGMLAELIAFGPAAGTVSSSWLGTVRYSQGSMPSTGTIVDSTVLSGSMEAPLPRTPRLAPLDPACYGAARNTPVVPTV